jgi:hypothetical protein
MPSEAIIQALRKRANELSDAYMRNVGNPARQLVGGGLRGYFGLEAPEYADAMGMDAYRNAAAFSNVPGVGAPAGAVKAMAAAPLIAKALRAAPREEALETARKNAVKMLGLPENNTPMDRARALGFDTEAFHGTRSDIRKLDKSKLGAATKAKSAEEAFFSAADPETAGSYALNLPDAYFKKAAKKAEDYFNRSRSDLTTRQQQLRSIVRDAESSKPAWGTPEYKKWEAANKPLFDELRAVDQQLGNEWQSFYMKNIRPLRDAAWDTGSNIMPLLLRTDGYKTRDFPMGFRDQSYFDIIRQAKSEGAPGVKLTNTTDAVGLGENAPVTDIYATIDPSRIRSRFAAFDPARMNENDLLGRADPKLLAALAAGTTTAATVSALRNKSEEEKKKKRDEK